MVFTRASQHLVLATALLAGIVSATASGLRAADSPERCRLAPALLELRQEYLREEEGLSQAYRGTKIPYLSPEERLKYRVTFKDGKIHDAEDAVMHNHRSAEDGFEDSYIFVKSQDGEYYMHRARLEDRVGVFHHSTFVAGQSVEGAGALMFDQGKLVAVSNVSGHYRPSPYHLHETLMDLKARGINVDDVELRGIGLDFMAENGVPLRGRDILGRIGPSDRAWSEIYLRLLKEKRDPTTRAMMALKRLGDAKLEAIDEEAITAFFRLLPPQGKKDLIRVLRSQAPPGFPLLKLTTPMMREASDPFVRHELLLLLIRRNEGVDLIASYIRDLSMISRPAGQRGALKILGKVLKDSPLAPKLRASFIDLGKQVQDPSVKREIQNVLALLPEQEVSREAAQARLIQAKARKLVRDTTQKTGVEAVVDHDLDMVLLKKQEGPGHARIVGGLEFDLDEETLVVQLVRIEKAGDRRQGLGTLLLAKVLAERPDVRRIQAALSQDNLKAYRDALARGLSPMDAIRETPAYKIQKALGFGKIDPERTHFAHQIILTTTRD